MTLTDYLTHPYTNEDQFTAFTYRYINEAYPCLRHMFFHIANESATNAIIRIKLAGMGVLPGVPDFCFLLPYRWFLELKMPHGTLSPKQVALHQLWTSHGIPVHVAYTPAQVIIVLDNVLSLQTVIRVAPIAPKNPILCH